MLQPNTYIQYNNLRIRNVMKMTFFSFLVSVCFYIFLKMILYTVFLDVFCSPLLRVLCISHNGCDLLLLCTYKRCFKCCNCTTTSMYNFTIQNHHPDHHRHQNSFPPSSFHSFFSSFHSFFDHDVVSNPPPKPSFAFCEFLFLCFYLSPFLCL